MKGYFFLLSVLYLAFLALAVWGLTTFLHMYITLKLLADIVLPGLCVWACYGLAFKKVYMGPIAWRMVYNLTFILGVFAVLLRGWPDKLGVPSPVGAPHVLDLALTFLPYILFAIPAVLYDHELKQKQKA